MARLTDEQRDAVRLQLAGLKGPALAALAAQLAASFGVSPATVYRASAASRDLHKRGGGPAPSPLPEAAERAIAGIVGLGGSVVRGAELARLNGLLGGPGEAAPGLGAIRAKLRRKGLSRRWVANARSLLPRRRFEAGAPNFMHQLDFTVAPQFYIEPGGAVGFEGPLQLSKNHPGNRRPRLWLYALLDDHSRAGFARFYSVQPNSWSAPDFLFRAWDAKEPDFPFAGMPRLLYTDRDPATTSKTFRQALERLGVEAVYHMPGQPQAKGKVERFIQTLNADQVVTRLAKFGSLEEANEYLRELLVAYNSRVHSVTKEAPFHRWRAIRADALRLLPREQLREVLLLKRFERSVPADLRLSVEGHVLQLPFRAPWVNLIGCRVEVLAGPSMRGHVLVLDAEGQAHEVPVMPPAQHPAGEFKATVQTRRQAALEAARAQDLSGLRLWGFGRGALGARSEGRVENPVPMLPVRTSEAEAFDEARLAGMPGAPPSFDLLDAIALLQRAGALGAPVSTAERAWLEARFAGRERVPAQELAALAGEIEAMGGIAREAAG